MGLFDSLFYQPLLNFLVLIYNRIPGKDLGLAVILLTILIKLILWPLNAKGLKSQKALKEIEPKVKEIREKFKNNKEEIAKKTFELYQEAKVNPFSGILLLFIQLPVLFALFKVFKIVASNGELADLYSFVFNPGQIRPYFLNINLSETNTILAALAGLLQFIQTKFFAPEMKLGDDKNKSMMAGIMQKQMTYFFPILTFFVLFKLPSAISLYLVTSTVLAIIQSAFIYKKNVFQPRNQSN